MNYVLRDFQSSHSYKKIEQNKNNSKITISGLVGVAKTILL